MKFFNKIIPKELKTQFAKNVMTLMTGKVIAQALTILLTPVITRLYGPEAFGVLGVFMSITGVLIGFTSLTYAMGIVLPKKDEDAKTLVKLCLLIAISFTILFLIVIVFFQQPIIKSLKLEPIQPFIFLIPLIFIFSALEAVFSHWLIRKKKFKETAKVDISQSIVQNGAKVGIGFLLPTSAVLIFTFVFGKFIHALLLAKSSVGKLFQTAKHFLAPDNFNRKSLINVARHYKDFPLYRFPQITLVAFSQNLPVLFLSGLFGPIYAGFYAVGRKVLVIPSNFISSAIQKAIYPRLADAQQKNEKLFPLIWKATLGLTVIGILPFGIISIFGPGIFSFALGAEWVSAGKYAQWLAVMVFFQFINKPAVAAIPVLRIQGSLLLYEILAVTLRVGSLLVGFYIYNNDLVAVALFCASSSFIYMLLIFYVLRRAYLT